MFNLESIFIKCQLETSRYLDENVACSWWHFRGQNYICLFTTGTLQCQYNVAYKWLINRDPFLGIFESNELPAAFFVLILHFGLCQLKI